MKAGNAVPLVCAALVVVAALAILAVVPAVARAQRGANCPAISAHGSPILDVFF